jgi:hypothetical protein
MHNEYNKYFKIIIPIFRFTQNHNVKDKHGGVQLS